ncbi:MULTISPECIES: hypothetical protein [Calothrix]|uniref:Transposase n=2 Tax=Calothrix TaxID=1186 RepID=A0ABR8A4E5_9CYAN|nr:MULTISPECIES: hypothetical protein [Calothrix]MBD2194679.1 hypothetical protein [Calothrix parietina FACHB-288]MBD2225171.1 hypothetical protein [Calothrix anomala FACHB-343]
MALIDIFSSEYEPGLQSQDGSDNSLQSYRLAGVWSFLGAIAQQLSRSNIFTKAAFKNNDFRKLECEMLWYYVFSTLVYELILKSWRYAFVKEKLRKF